MMIYEYHLDLDLVVGIVVVAHALAVLIHAASPVGELHLIMLVR